ncbi:hypothetical protein DPMN_002408 [Dreissena polymorpha]|uniref:Uncharacterized protein n=1 Tax=Dreissena polymorpha TaxID=45954 RepID=A0A9D4MJ20_DREPO|nr:hypothetical protein DPMN_002408 [Dreissena polymorpha]
MRSLRDCEVVVRTLDRTQVKGSIGDCDVVVRTHERTCKGSIRDCEVLVRKHQSTRNDSLREKNLLKTIEHLSKCLPSMKKEIGHGRQYNIHNTIHSETLKSQHKKEKSHLNAYFEDNQNKEKYSKVLAKIISY